MIMFSLIVIYERGFVVMFDVPVFEPFAQLAFFQQKSGIRVFFVVFRADKVNRCNERSAFANTPADFLEKIALQIIKVANQIVVLRCNLKLAFFEISDERFELNTSFSGSFACDCDAGRRAVHACHFPAVLCQENGMPSDATGNIESASRL